MSRLKAMLHFPEGRTHWMWSWGFLSCNRNEKVSQTKGTVTQKWVHIKNGSRIKAVLHS